MMFGWCSFIGIFQSGNTVSLGLINENITQKIPYNTLVSVTRWVKMTQWEWKMLDTTHSGGKFEYKMTGDEKSIVI